MNVADVTLQERTLRAYLSLMRLRVFWGGQLVMLAAGESARPVALAAAAAAGAVLWVDADEASLRRAGKSGVVNFQVSGLAEAVRILKNEVRQKRPVSVGLLDTEDCAWSEAVRRGLQPDALLGAEGLPFSEGARAAFDWLRQRGAAVLEQGGPEHMVRCAAAADWRARRAADAVLLEAARAVPGAAGVRAAQWHTAAPQLFPRDLFRCDAAAWDASDDSA